MKKTLAVLTFFLLGGAVYSQQSWNMTYHDSWQASHTGAYYNDCWGYVDSAGREYAIFGSNRSTHFLDVTNPDDIVHVGTFDGVNTNTVWRDFKVWSHYAFGVNDGGGIGSLQIFDLQYLPDSVVKIYDNDSLGSNTHNIQMWRSELYMIDNRGSNPNGSSFSNPVRVVDVSDPFNPTTIGGFYDNNYPTHDGYVYHDTLYLNVIFGPNTGLYVMNFRAPAFPTIIGSMTNYPEKGLNHSCWGTWDRNTLVMIDETHGSAVKVVDVSNPANPQTVSTFRTFAGAIAHNPFIVDTLAFISYYHDGLQVWSIADPANPVQVAYYDTDTTLGSGSNYSGYEGCWGTYPFFPSGTLIASDINNGLFTITLDGWTAPTPPPLPVGLDPADDVWKMSVYPNPSSGKVTISLDEPVNQNILVELYSIDGKKAYSKRVTGTFGNYDFDFSSLSSGLYQVRVSAENYERRARLILN